MTRTPTDKPEPILKLSSKDYIAYGHTAIVLALMLFFRFIPPFGGLTPVGVTIIGIFLGLLYGYCTVGFIWPSLLALLAFGTSGFITVKAAFAAGFGHDTTILIFLLFVFSALINEAKIGDSIAIWFLRRKVILGRPWLLSFFILLATFAIQPFVSIYMTILLMWNIFYSIVLQLGFKKGDKYPALMLVGITLASACSMEAVPWNPLAVLISGNMQKLAGITINFSVYFLLISLIGVTVLSLYILVCKYIIRPDIAPLLAFNEDYVRTLEQKPLSSYQKLIVALLGLLVLLMFAPSLLPKNWFICQLLKSIGITGSVAICLIVASILTFQGHSLVDFKTLVTKGVQWNVVIMFTAVLPIAASFGSQETGISTLIVTLLQPILGSVSPLVFCILTIFFALTITQFSNNMVCAIVLVPIIYNFSSALGINSAILAILLVPALSTALVTPAGSGSASLIHGNDEWIGTQYAYRYTVLIYVIMLLVLIAVGLPLAFLIF